MNINTTTNLLISKFPTGVVSDSPKVENCIICLERYETEERVTELSCGHLFHYSCIEKWFDESTTCPCCRKDYKENEVMKEFGDEDMDETSEDNEMEVWVWIKNTISVRRIEIV